MVVEVAADTDRLFILIMLIVPSVIEIKIITIPIISQITNFILDTHWTVAMRYPLSAANPNPTKNSDPKNNNANISNNDFTVSASRPRLESESGELIAEYSPTMIIPTNNKANTPHPIANHCIVILLPCLVMI